MVADILEGGGAPWQLDKSGLDAGSSDIGDCVGPKALNCVLDSNMTSVESIICHFPCVKCSELCPLAVHPNSPSDFHFGLYHGRCSTATCLQQDQPFFICFPCLQLPLPFKGHHKGYIAEWRAVQRHAQSKFHQKAMEKWRASNAPSRFQGHIETTVDTMQNASDTLPLDPTECCTEDITDDIHTNEDFELKSLDQLSSLGFASGSKSPQFIWDSLKGHGSGLKSLTARAFAVPLDKVTLQESEFSILLSSLLIELTERQRELLAEILLLAGNSSSKDLSIFQSTRLPTSTEDFDRFYLKGKDSIMQNLPIPILQSAADGSHARVSLPDLIANELGKAQSYDDLQLSAELQVQESDREPNDAATPNGRRLLLSLQQDSTNDPHNQCVFNLWLREWRDDFDPNNTKSSRNQVWVNTFTIGPGIDATNGATTYFMALGAKGDDHSVIEKSLLQEIQGFNSAGHDIFHGGLKKVVRVRLGKLVTGVDRPERTAMFSVGDHNGSFSSCWGVSTRIDNRLKENRLPSCSRCRKRRMVELGLCHPVRSDNNRCSGPQCQNWNLYHPTLFFSAPKNYPTVCDRSTGAPKPALGRPIFNVKRNAGSQTSQNGGTTEERRNNPTRTKRNRSESQDEGPKLRSHPISIPWLKDAVLFAHHNMKTPLSSVLPNGKRFWNKAQASAYLRSCGCTNKLIDSVYASAKNADTFPPFPETWIDEQGLERCHFAPMHMIFLGNVKTVLEILCTWMGSHETLATFGKQMNTYLTHVKMLRCTRYFSSQPLSTSSWGTGTWVSENYLFACRILKFVMLLPCFKSDRLHRREDFALEYQQVSRFVCAANVAISWIMTNQKEIHRLPNVVKVFLDTMFEMDVLVGSDGQSGSESVGSAKLSHVMKSNSLGLLFISEYHDDMGPACLHWEGGFEGERKIQQVKPALSIKHCLTNGVDDMF